MWLWGQGLGADLWSQIWVGRLGKLWAGAAEGTACVVGSGYLGEPGGASG